MQVLVTPLGMMFQLTAARRRLVSASEILVFTIRFNSQPPEGGWCSLSTNTSRPLRFQLTAARRRLEDLASVTPENIVVSTHSRPKAAGLCRHFEVWDLFGFQLTAARRRLDWFLLTGLGSEFVSTHSRPKAAGWLCLLMLLM